MTNLNRGVIHSHRQGHRHYDRQEVHDCQLYAAVNDIEHTKAKVHHPQTNGICELFRKTIFS